MSKLGRALKGHAEAAIQNDGKWLMGVNGIVADNADPDRQHRVRVIIPSIDEDMIFDEWARQMVFCLGNGYGSVFIPPKGSEVVLFGQLGQKYNLFYAGLYNEEMQIAADFEDSTVSGFRVPGDLKLIADLDAQIRAGRLAIEVDGQFNIVAPGGMFVNGKRTL